MNTPLPPIYRDCRLLLIHTEVMVRQFSRYHKYTVGTDLRRAAMTVMRTVTYAVRDKPHQAQHVQNLVWRVDDYKLTLQLSMDVGAFKHSVKLSKKMGEPPKEVPSFQAFEKAVQLSTSIGKQCGGWWQALARQQPSTLVAQDGTTAHAAPIASAGRKPETRSTARSLH